MGKSKYVNKAGKSHLRNMAGEECIDIMNDSKTNFFCSPVIPGKNSERKGEKSFKLETRVKNIRYLISRYFHLLGLNL